MHGRCRTPIFSLSAHATDIARGKSPLSATWARTKSVCRANWGCAPPLAILISFAPGYIIRVHTSPVHKLLGNFSATFSLLSNFQCIGKLPSFCVSIVTVMLLLRVKQLSAEYRCVEKISVQSSSFSIR